MAQYDPYQDEERSLITPAVKHFPITPDNDADIPVRPRVLIALTNGNVAVRDVFGVAVIYPMLAGQVLPFSAVRVLATGTTATCVGWL